MPDDLAVVGGGRNPCTGKAQVLILPWQTVSGKAADFPFQCLTWDEVASVREEVVRASKHQPEPLSHSDGLREGGDILRSALERAGEGPLAGLDDIFVRLAFLVRGIVEEHAYINGNKRTGLAVLGATMRINGLDLPEGHATLAFMERIAMSQEELDSIAAWLRSAATPK